MAGRNALQSRKPLSSQAGPYTPRRLEACPAIATDFAQFLRECVPLVLVFLIVLVISKIDMFEG